jgi:hypothetical protein
MLTKHTSDAPRIPLSPAMTFCLMTGAELTARLRGWVALAHAGLYGSFEARITAVEAERAKGVRHVRWRGVFKHGEHFRSGELATHKGALWVCQRDTSQTPGRPADGDASGWTLVVKSGSVEALR